jgi:hypothetical protein
MLMNYNEKQKYDLKEKLRIKRFFCCCFKEKEPENAEKDASGTHRTIARKSRKLTPNEASLEKVLQTPECLDETAITINLMARRLLCDMFEIPVFKDLLKSKIEMKMKELAVSCSLLLLLYFPHLFHS